MTTQVDVLNRARSWIGTKEQPLGSNHVPGVTDWYGIGNGPWCAMWLSRVFFDAGLPLPATIAKGFAYCPSGVSWFKRQNRWKTSNPQPGDVVFYQWPGSDRAEHIGIVEGVNGDGSISAIEANTNTQGSAEGLYVMRQTRKRFILGYGVPSFDGSSIPAPVPQNPNTNTDTWLKGVVDKMQTIDLRGKLPVRGGHVDNMQGLLLAAQCPNPKALVGSNGCPDGEAGQGTKDQLTWFQRMKGLEADSVCGERTWAALIQH